MTPRDALGAKAIRRARGDRPFTSPCWLIKNQYDREHVMNDREERIRHRAYTLWRAAGEPEGRGAEFWSLAEQEIVDEEAAPSGELPPDIPTNPKASERGPEGEAAPKPRKVAAERENEHAGNKPGSTDRERD
jgi:hypothetical protein